MGERIFSLYEIEQFIREAGAEKVTEDAVRDLEREIEKLAKTVTKSAIKYAQHAGRKRLIRTSDVLLTKKADPAFVNEAATGAQKTSGQAQAQQIRPQAPQGI